jgi:hypothetical protein
LMVEEVLAVEKRFVDLKYTRGRCRSNRNVIPVGLCITIGFLSLVCSVDEYMKLERW